MIKKTLLISLVLFGVMFSQITGACPAATSDNFEQAKQNIFSIIDKGDFAKAESAISKLSSDFSGQQGLPEALYWLAVRYEWSGRPEEAKRIYQQVITSYPDNIWSKKAKLGNARTDAISLVLLQNYDGAKQAIDKLVSDFSGHPDLAETLYWIMYRFEWQNKDGDATQVCQQIVQIFPNSSWASKARLNISKAEIILLINAQNYGNAEMAIKKLIADFNNNPDLPEALYRIEQGFEWQNRYEEAKRICQRIIQNSSDGQYANKAKLGISRSEVMGLIIDNFKNNSQDYSGSEKAVDNLVNNFAGHPDLPESLCWIAERYEWINRFAESKKIYQQVIQRYPDSQFASKAKLGASIADVRSLIVAQDCNGAEKALDKVVADFAGHPDLPKLIIIVGEQFYKEGLAKESKGLGVQAKDSFQRAINIWDGFISKNPGSVLIPEVCYWSGYCFQKLGEYLKAAEAFGSSYKANTEFMYADYCLFEQADCYEKAKATQADITITVDQIKEIYREVVAKYPKSEYAFKAALRLDELHNGTE